jgi:DNA repair exonuclease SbcCD nuclease subunit
MLILRLGDPHVKVSNIEESEKLLSFVLETAKLNKVDRIEILGDLTHTHAVVRLEVQEFWTKWLKTLSNSYHTYVLVGNHDLSGNYNSKFSSLTTFSFLEHTMLHIIEDATQERIFGYLPYIHDHKTFIDSANALADKGAKVLICHQTLQGSRYESGFYAADGVPTGDWSARFTHIISGHIHTEQNFENVIYPGTARWDGVVDANLRKGIWIYEHDDTTGQIIRSDYFSTENVCSPLKSITYNEGDKAPDVWPDNARVTLELSGSSEWVNKQKQAFKGKASFKTKITDTKKAENRKAGRNLEDFLQNVFVSSNKDNLLKFAKELGLV